MKFQDIVGQEDIKKRLIRSVDENRVSHAQLFLGPEGSGTLAMAIAYAQFINCKNRNEGDSCGVCPSCLKIAKLIHPDLHFVYPIAATKAHPKKPISKDFLNEWRSKVAENPYFNIFDWYEHIEMENKQGIINADDCNDIIRQLGLKTYEAEYKIMIIWMVEKLYHSAAPKLLKILEEPPPRTLFVLVAESQDQILNTILSRTQLVKFNALSDEHIYQTLSDKYNCKEKDATTIANLVDGNINQAIKLIGNTEEEDQSFQNFISWMRLCYANKIVEITKVINEFASLGREKQKNFLNYSSRVIRNSLMINLNNDELVKLNQAERDFAQKFSPFINKENIFHITEELQKAVFHIERNVNAKMVFMDLSLKMSKLLRLSPTN